MGTFDPCVCTEEPHIVALYLDGVMVGQMAGHDLQQPLDIKLNQEVDVVLEQSYTVQCNVEGGNPPPVLRLSSGGLLYENVEVTQRTQRNPDNWMSEPNNAVNATMTWKATVKNIGLPLRCEATVEDPEPIYTNFVPVVADSKPSSTELYHCLTDK